MDRINQIRATGCEIVHIARYINAVSVRGTPDQILIAEGLPFVKSARPVFAYPADYLIPEGKTIDADPEDYDRSWGQLAVLNIPAAHDRGYRGEGVIIGLQDTGFEPGSHICLRGINVLASYDFVNNDGNVGDENDLGRADHGTKVLSVIAGYEPGAFIGVAPEASFVLTKTENTSSETPIEEDHWVAGLWFHDSLGTQVLSSSLSYTDWYDYEELDGRSAVTSIAADSAAAAGIIIVNSAGNQGRNQYPYNKVGAPADARSVITAGGVLYDSTAWSASAQGPTYDGRIKPNVVAPGVGVYALNEYSYTGYIPRNGTSFSCPLVSGIVALMVEAQPFITPAQARQILHETSSLAQNPDTLRGYGIPNALLAVMRAEQVRVRDNLGVNPVSNTFSLYPNPTNSSTTLHFYSPILKSTTLKIYDLQGRLIHTSQVNAGAWSQVVDVTAFPAGNYVVRMKNEEGRMNVTKRIVLVK